MGFYSLIIIPLLIIGLFIGWIVNLVAFFDCDFDLPMKCEAVRGIGIVVPFVGGVTGYMDLGQ
jgi:hypothetical protein